MELRLRRVPSRTLRGIRGLPDWAGTAGGRGQEEEALGETGLDFCWVLRVLSPVFWCLRTKKQIEILFLRIL